MNPGRFGPGSFRPGSFRPGSFRPNLGVGRFGLGRWVDSAPGLGLITLEGNQLNYNYFAQKM